MAELNQIKVGVGAIVFKDDRVLLVKRKNPPYPNEWAIPGGKVRYGETLKQAVAREIREETGIDIDVMEPVFTFEVLPEDKQSDTGFHYVVIDFNAVYTSGDILAADDAREAAWISRDRFKKIDINQITKSVLRDKFRFP